jgi:sucrose-phosphate synthase
VPEKYDVIPPGIDLSRFFPFNEKREWDEEEQKVRDHIRNELWRFFTNMHKPIILALCRPEKKKNIAGLIQAYGEDKDLQKKANLAIFAGIRKDIQEMPELDKEVLTEILLLMDKYNLYGRMAIPKTHEVEYEVPELYRIAAESRGVFINPAFSENFGLTLIEAAASGLPVVATDDGGPRDIIGNLDHGFLVKVHDYKNISKAIHKVIDDEKTWDEFSNNGIRSVHNFYSWGAHTDAYLKSLKEMLESMKEKPKTFLSTGKKLLKYEKLMIFDIDDTLIGHEEAQEKLKQVILENQPQIGFGVATGRTIDSAIAVLKEHNFVMPDIIISSVGSEIYYKNKDDEYFYATGWDKHISHLWKRNKIVELLDEFDFLKLQEDETQRKYKISYYHEATEEQLNQVIEKLVKNNIKANFIISHKKYIDVLPYRASKGRAVRYMAYRWNIPHENILVAGDSGNDEDMLRGELLGIVVGQHSDELKKLKGRRRIYFAKEKATAGILEGAYYYNFFEKG